jgi:hypothetical protein
MVMIILVSNVLPGEQIGCIPFDQLEPRFPFGEIEFRYLNAKPPRTRVRADQKIKAFVWFDLVEGAIRIHRIEDLSLTFLLIFGHRRALGHWLGVRRTCSSP